MKAVQHWRCESCKGYNDILNVSCSFCKVYKPSWISAKYQMLVELERGIFDCNGVLSRYDYDWEGRAKKLTMSTPNEDLHAKFFNEEALLVVNMSDIDLDEHIHELETIAREAKARILAATEEKRTRRAKAGNKAWRIEPNGPDPNVTDSLNKVKQRSQRMGKLDTMRQKMSALGLSDADIDAMMSKMIAAARKEPEALKQEAKLKDDLKTPKAPIISTEEERQAVKDQKKLFEQQDKLDEQKAKAEAQENNQPITGQPESSIKPALPDWLSKLT